MSYGFKIKYIGTYGKIFRVHDGGFASYGEAVEAKDEQWEEMARKWNNCEPVDYEIIEER